MYQVEVIDNTMDNFKDVDLVWDELKNCAHSDTPIFSWVLLQFVLTI